jgi:hypothetical protein
MKIAITYGDRTYYPGIVILGRLNEGAAAQMAALRGPVTGKVRVGQS